MEKKATPAPTSTNIPKVIKGTVKAVFSGDYVTISKSSKTGPT